MKQGRNEMCNCGSGKKFKKCCIHNISNTTEKLVNDVSIEISNTTERIVSTNDNFENSDDIKYVTSVGNLPNSIKSRIKKYTNKFPSKVGQCFYNGCLLSLNVPGVRIVYGWYSTPIAKNVFLQHLNNQDFSTYLDTINSLPFFFNVRNIEDKFIEVSHTIKGGGKMVIEPNKNVFWVTHCWNEFEGKYFDNTVETSRRNGDMKHWVNYKVGSIINQEEIFNQHISKNLYTETIYRCLN